jgi:hypothetical protein
MIVLDMIFSSQMSGDLPEFASRASGSVQAIGHSYRLGRACLDLRLVAGRYVSSRWPVPFCAHHQMFTRRVLAKPLTSRMASFRVDVVNWTGPGSWRTA